MSCLFCDMAQNKKLHDYQHCYVIKDEFPVSKGHLLIISKEHVETWFHASDAAKIEMIKVLDSLKVALDEELHPDGYNIGLNCGKAAGQTIMHLHLHLIPRYHGDTENPRGGVRGVIPSKQQY